RLNDRVFAQRGIRLFKSFPFPQEEGTLRSAMNDAGFEDVEITPLDVIAREYWPAPHDWAETDGWVLVRGTVGEP
ncbi:MAG: hypothetical protein WB783_15690, partial [Arenicellales bacterium]